MASTIQEQLLDEFLQAASGPGMPGPYTDEAGTARELFAEMVKAAVERSAATNQPAAKTGTTTASGASSPSAISTVLKSGFGLLPLVGELIGLFGGGGSEQPEPLIKYVMPGPLDIESAETDAGLSSVDYDQMGMPRVYAGGLTQQPGAELSSLEYDQMNLAGSGLEQQAAADFSRPGYQKMAAPRDYGRAVSPLGGTGGTVRSGAEYGLASGAPQITVNVQAMDARSFMDRSADIAAAVRNAMLNLNSINDVVNEL